MEDCDECGELGTNVLKAPSEVGRSNLGSDGVLTLGMDEGAFPWIGGVYRGLGGGVWTVRCRICATCRYALSIGDPEESEG